jgi:hypothetical protein
MAQVVSHQLHTVEAQVHARINLVGFVVDRGTETGFPPTSSVFHVSDIPPRLSALIYHLEGRTMSPLVATVQGHDLTWFM